MNYYYIFVKYTKPHPIYKGLYTGHIVKANSLKEAQGITEKHGIANPFHSENVKSRTYRRLDMRLKHNKDTIRRRHQGRSGSVWFEENGKLQKETK